MKQCKIFILEVNHVKDYKLSIYPIQNEHVIYFNKSDSFQKKKCFLRLDVTNPSGSKSLTKPFMVNVFSYIKRHIAP